MDGVTIQDLQNAKLDCDLIDAFANSTDPTAVDRLGNTRKTLSGTVADIQAQVDTQIGDLTAAVNNASSSASAAAESEANAANSESAATTAAATSNVYPNTAASNVPRGLTQASVGTITPGSGGANGTFSLSWSGGNFSINPTGTFTVSGGAVTAVTITGPGLYIGASPTVPTPSFTASSGLTGAAVALTAQFLVTSGQGYWVTSATGKQLDRYKNVSGIATSDAANVPSIFGATATASYVADRIARNTTTSRNLFDVNAYTSGQGIVASTGNLTASVNYNATDYIAVAPGGSLISSANSYNFSNTGLAWYDQNKNYISGTQTILTAGVAVPVPAGAYYVRITYVTGTNFATLMICNAAALPSVYQSFNEPAIFPWLTAGVAASIAARPKAVFNMFDPSGMKTLTKFNTSTGAEISDTSGSFVVTNYMPVQPGVTFTTYPALAAMSNRVCVFYDKNLNILQVIQAVASGWPNGQVFTPPAGAVYCRFCLATYLTGGLLAPYVPQGEVSFFIALPSTVTLGHIHTHTPVAISDVRVWSGRDSAAIGDSMSTGSSRWDYYLAAYLGCTHIQYAASGRRMYQALLDGFSNPLTAASFTGKSYVTFLMGVNDAANSTPLGTIADLAPTMSNLYSFYGNLRLAIETLIGWNDNMTIVLCTPIYNKTQDVTPNAVGLVLEDYRNAIRAVAYKYGLPLLDFGRLSQLNAVNIDNWSTDGTHPKDTASYIALMTNPAIGLFRSLYPRV